VSIRADSWILFSFHDSFAEYSRVMGPIRLTRLQAREVDRIAIEAYGMPGIVLMENAARNAADIIVATTAAPDAHVAILCGTGNNGGDGYAIARHLHNRRHRVTIYEDDNASARRSADCETNRRITRAMQLPHRALSDFVEPHAHDRAHDVIIDALFGTGLARPVEGVYRDAIDRANALGIPIIAIDIPSGLDADTGLPLGVAVRAAATITFAAEKIGFANPASRAHTGIVTVADIGCPAEIIAQAAKIHP
jgi:NAD(P)H-hydrate epimerase